LIVLLCIGAVVFGALFTFENTTTVSPVVLGAVLPELAIGYYLVLMLIIGILLGSFCCYLGMQKKLFQAGRENARLRRNLHKLEKNDKQAVSEQKQLSKD
jgi:uncharacterized integral membrane protein